MRRSPQHHRFMATVRDRTTLDEAPTVGSMCVATVGALDEPLLLTTPDGRPAQPSGGRCLEPAVLTVNQRLPGCTHGNSARLEGG